MPAPPAVNLKHRGLAALLAWLVPGLGHLYQGRRGKAVLYFVCIMGLYLAGMVMGEWRIVYWRWVNPFQNAEDFRLWFPAQFWVGIVGFPALVQATLAKYGMAPILGGFVAEPPLNVINGVHNSAGRFVDVGSVYTCVAGLLNIFAIYDAYDGPALADEPEAAPAPAAATPVAEAKPSPSPVPAPAPVPEPAA